MTWVKAVSIAGSAQEGTSPPDAQGLTWPLLTTLVVRIARESAQGYAVGKFSLAAADANQSSTAVSIDFNRLSADHAEFKFRVAYKTLTDLAVVVTDRLPDGEWAVNIAYTNFYGTVVYARRPTLILLPDAIDLYPVLAMSNEP